MVREGKAPQNRLNIKKILIDNGPINTEQLCENSDNKQKFILGD